MKAILVLKEMPKECDECPLYDGAWGVYCMATNEPVKAEEKPSWCPIKPIPEKRILPSWQVNNTNYGEEPWFSDGWNACLEELEK